MFCERSVCVWEKESERERERVSKSVRVRVRERENVTITIQVCMGSTGSSGCKRGFKSLIIFLPWKSPGSCYLFHWVLHTWNSQCTSNNNPTMGTYPRLFLCFTPSTYLRRGLNLPYLLTWGKMQVWSPTYLYWAPESRRKISFIDNVLFVSAVGLFHEIKVICLKTLLYFHSDRQVKNRHVPEDSFRHVLPTLMSVGGL